MTNSELALQSITDGMVVGLGTGRAAEAFLRALGERIRTGLSVRGVPTSQKSARLAQELGIPLTTLDDVQGRIDICVDGADEFDPQLNLVKGLGGALLREKVVASAAQEFLVLVGPDNLDLKRAKQTIGERGVLPIETVPFASAVCARQLQERGLEATLRMAEGRPFVTDNGNWIFDAKIPPLADPWSFEMSLLTIPGLVDTGLFLGMADRVLVQDGSRVVIVERMERP
jgi:ribose 5-phosphate isomerase A